MSSLGFKIGDGGDRVKVSLETFYNDFKIGFFSGDAVAQVAFTLVAYRPDGRIAYSRTYQGVGMEKDILLATGDNASGSAEGPYQRHGRDDRGQGPPEALVHAAAPVRTTAAAPSS